MSVQNKSMVILRRFNSDDSVIWNELIDKSVNGTFLFRREFMDYHADRFEDFSYLVWRGKELIGVFVAGRSRTTSEQSTIIAHPGLTYGGLVCALELKFPLFEEVYNSIQEEYKSLGFSKLVIKLVGQVFCKFPTDSSRFYFNRTGFSLANRELNSVIDLTKPLNISKGRKDNVRKARNYGLDITDSNDFSSFWPILTDNLWRTHSVSPPHSEAEIKSLHERLPNNIKLYTASYNKQIIAGILLFLDDLHGFIHTQYISANEQGKQIGAVDALILHILEFANQPYLRFSFGISTAKGELNYGLLAQKEGFGATVEVLDTYTKNI